MRRSSGLATVPGLRRSLKDSGVDGHLLDEALKNTIKEKKLKKDLHIKLDLA